MKLRKPLALCGKRLFCLWAILVTWTISAAASFLLYSAGVDRENLVMIFLLGVLACAALTGGWLCACIASVLSVSSLHFLCPSLPGQGAEDMLLLFFFLFASLLCGVLASRGKKLAAAAERERRVAQAMYDITESFLNLTGTEEIVENGIKRIVELTGRACHVLLYGNEAEERGTEFCTPNYSEEGMVFLDLPLQGRNRQLGRIRLAGEKEALSAEEDRLVRTAADQLGVALDREYVYTEREKIRLDMEGERLRTTLLRSVSHDIRTPLTGILGASGTICQEYGRLSGDEVRRLASDIREESSWLVMTVQNILDMTRIADGKLEVNRQFVPVDELLEQAAARMALRSDAGRLRVVRPDKLLFVEADAGLFIQALVNLLDNAFKYSGGESEVELSAYQKEGRVIFQVTDNGGGIDPAVGDKLFDSFVTLPKNASDRGRGVGLGLPICKAIALAHGGSIEAENKEGGGAVFRIALRAEEA